MQENVCLSELGKGLNPCRMRQRPLAPALKRLFSLCLSRSGCGRLGRGLGLPQTFLCMKTFAPRGAKGFRSRTPKNAFPLCSNVGGYTTSIVKSARVNARRLCRRPCPFHSACGRGQPPPKSHSPQSFSRCVSAGCVVILGASAQASTAETRIFKIFRGPARRGVKRPKGRLLGGKRPCEHIAPKGASSFFCF